MGLLCISGLLRRVNRFRMGKHFGNGKGPCAVKLIMGPIISRRLSDIMSLLPSLSPWVFAPSLGGERGTVGCGRLSQGRQELLCVPDQRQDRGLPAASLSPTMAPSRPQPYIQSHDHQPGHPLELLRSFFFNYRHLGPSPKLLFNWSVLLGTHSF